METYTEAQELTRRTVRDFAEKEVKPGATERDRTGEFDYALFRRLGDLGITGIMHPEEYGGSNAGFLAWQLAIEELAKADAALALTAFVGNAVLMPSKIPDDMHDEWMEKYVYPTVRAETVMSGAITEPDAGTDTRAIKTTAVLDGDEWVINGTKAFCTNAGLDNCPYTGVLCKINDDPLQFEMIIVPKGTPGFTIAPKYRKMGVRSAYTSELYFDDCRVPKWQMLGYEGDEGGARSMIAQQGFAEARISTTTVGIGIHAACFDECMKYVQQRKTFGRPIGHYQFVQGMLVDMYTDLECSRLLRDKAARLLEEGGAPLLEACTFKYFGAEAARRATDNAVQIFGGLGYIDDTPVSRFYRDVRWVPIGDGTNEVQKLVMARILLAQERIAAG